MIWQSSNRTITWHKHFSYRAQITFTSSLGQNVPTSRQMRVRVPLPGDNTDMLNIIKAQALELIVNDKFFKFLFFPWAHLPPVKKQRCWGKEVIWLVNCQLQWLSLDALAVLRPKIQKPKPTNHHQQKQNKKLLCPLISHQKNPYAALTILKKLPGHFREATLGLQLLALATKNAVPGNLVPGNLKITFPIPLSSRVEGTLL